MSLVPTLKLSLEMTNTLSQIERNGLRINLDTLADIRKQYEEEMQELEIDSCNSHEMRWVTRPSTCPAQTTAACCFTHAKSVTRRSGRVRSTSVTRCADQP